MRIFAAIMLSISTLFANAQSTDTRIFELRIYYCHPGKLEDLVTRFTNHTTRLFEKHGMENIGYWIPTDNKENALYYVLAYPDRAARDASWKAFNSDPEWQTARNKSEENGKIVERVSSTFMEVSAISPAIKGSLASPVRKFELRTYYILPGRKQELIDRFKNYTIRLLSKEGIQHIAYWTTLEQDGKEPKLVYILAHKSQATATAGWDAFRKNPEWIKAKAESEKDHPIVEKMESVFMDPLPFSKIK